MQAEDVLVGRDEVEDFFVGRFGLGRAGERLDEILLEAGQADGLVGDFTQGDDGVLVVVAVDGHLLAAAEVASALSGQQHQFEPIWDFLNAVFDRHARHAAALQLSGS